MNVLGINTVGKNAFVYLKNNNKVDYISINQSVKVSEMLLNSIDELLMRNALTLSDVGCLACCVGPGSFTGIRIGIATCKSFLIANKDLKCVAYNTFEPYKYTIKNGDLYSVCTKSTLYKCKVENCDLKQIEVVDLNSADTECGYLIDGEVYSDNSKCFKKIAFNVQDYFDLIDEKIINKIFVSENELVPNYACESQAERNLKNGDK